jgi:hypothetical protein
MSDRNIPSKDETPIPLTAEYDAAVAAWKDAHGHQFKPCTDADHAWVAGYARSFVDRRLAVETGCVGCAQGWHRQPGYPDATKHLHCPPQFIECNGPAETSPEPVVRLLMSVDAHLHNAKFEEGGTVRRQLHEAIRRLRPCYEEAAPISQATWDALGSSENGKPPHPDTFHKPGCAWLEDREADCTCDTRRADARTRIAENLGPEAAAGVGVIDLPGSSFAHRDDETAIADDDGDEL